MRRRALLSMSLLLIAGATIAAAIVFTWQWRVLGKMTAVFDYNRSGAPEIDEVGPVARPHFGEYDRNGNGRLDRLELARYLLAGNARAIRVKWRGHGLPDAKVPAQVAPAQMDAALKQMVDVLELSGATLIVGRNGHELYRGSAGRIDANTQVPVASASKWVSSAVLMRLVEAGKLKLDRPIGAYLPELQGHWAGVTLRQLLTLTSGAPEGHAFENSPLTPYPQVFAHLVAKPAHAKAGTEFTYGGITLQIAGYLAQQVTHRSWNALFVQQVAAPLGMTQSIYGHPVWEGKADAVASPNIAAGLHTTAEDYFRFLSALQPADASGGLLSATSIREMETDYTSSLRQNSRPPGVADDWSYGLGLWCERRHSRRCDLVSSAGSYGAYPWIDRRSGTYGVLVVIGNVKEVMPFALHMRRLSENLANTSPAPEENK